MWLSTGRGTVASATTACSRAPRARARSEGTGHSPFDDFIFTDTPKEKKFASVLGQLALWFFEEPDYVRYEMVSPSVQ